MKVLMGPYTVERGRRLDHDPPGTAATAREMCRETEKSDEPWMPPRLTP
jgi:hypothetical protein